MRSAGPIRALSAAALSFRGPLFPPPHVPTRRLTSPRALATAAGGGGIVQQIYDRAAIGDLDGCAVAMDALAPEVAGMVQGDAGGKSGGPVGYHHVHSDAAMSIGIFVLPPGARLPLHDHPEMSVLSKLLFGRLRVTSYDLPPSAPPPQRTLFGFGGDARLLRCEPPRVHEVAAPIETLRLDAVCGNIHAFEALEHTAIFDVLAPPYSDRDGRSCHYYEADDDHVLREVPWPADLRVVNRVYSGETPLL